MKTATAFLAAAGMLFCAPAQAEVYGPPAPEAIIERLPDEFRLDPDESLEALEARLQRDTDRSWRLFWIGQGLGVADIALTCAILAKGGRELNPIYGKNANCGRIAAIRGGLGVLQYFIARHGIRKDPSGTAKSFRIVVVAQGFPVIWNAIQLAK